jgi:mRNA-degrading endonuclease RelE of RelBE toxin-antitoxin system
MKLDYAPRALAALEFAPERIRKAFYKQVRLLAINLRHPLLQTKKYNDGKGWWQARVNDDWRFYSPVVDETYVIQDVIKHPK